jgi:hypothetical protein
VTIKRLLVALALILPASSALADCGEEIDALLDRSLADGPYRMTMQVRMDGTPGEMVAEVVPPDQLHSTTTIPGYSQETIVIDGKGWMRFGEGNWISMPQPLVLQTLQSFGSAATSDDRIILNPLCSGETLVEGETLLVYSFTVEAYGAEALTTLYADPTSKLIMRFGGVTENGGVLYENLTTLVYDPTIVIVAPLGAGESSEGTP